MLKAQERRLRLQRLRGELVDRDRAKALVFRLARQERDAWLSWPTRVAALIAAELTAAGDPVQRVVFQKAAQTGATEAGNNWLGFIMHHAPGPGRGPAG